MCPIQSIRPFALATCLAALLALPTAAAVRLGTPNGETLTGTNRKDQITGDAGNDRLKGLAGNDTYYFADGWGRDTLKEQAFSRVNGKRVPGGTDTLSFRQVKGGGVQVTLIPEWRGINPANNKAIGAAGEAVDLGRSVVENVDGTTNKDHLTGGAAANRLDSGGGSSDTLRDYGGWNDGPGGNPELPSSNDAYVGVAANTGIVAIVDWGGTADLLDLRPLRSDQAYLAQINCDSDEDWECLQILTGSGTGQVTVYGQFGEYSDYTSKYGQHGQIETVRFADGTITFGGTAARSAGGGRDGTALLSRAETKRQQELAKQAPALARQALKQAQDLPQP